MRDVGDGSATMQDAVSPQRSLHMSDATVLPVSSLECWKNYIFW